MTEQTASHPIYLETNVFIRAVEGLEGASLLPKKLMASLRGRPTLAVTSEITLAEVLAPTKRPQAMPFPMKQRAYLDLLVWSNFIKLLPVSRKLLIETADLRRVTSLKLPDAIHLASATEANCRFFVSHDEDFRKLPVGMIRVNPDDEHGIDRLLSAIV
ncbi:MAG: type II toxin-antitoxin system VapC family toxin [Variibacter sp.]